MILKPERVSHLTLKVENWSFGPQCSLDITTLGKECDS